MSMQKFIEIQQEKLKKAKFTRDDDMRQIIDDHIEALDLLIRNYRYPKYAEPEADELALVCAVLNHNEIPSGTIWSTHDINFEIAKAFLEEYPLGSTEWGVDFDYEETVCEFGKKYCEDNNIRIL